MVEKIRQDDAERTAREAKKERRHSESEVTPEPVSAPRMALMGPARY